MKKWGCLYLLIICAPLATACDKPVLAPATAFESADVVFRGKIENLRYLDNPEQTKLEPKIIVTFLVSEVWKGKAEKNTIIHTTHNKSTCNGYVFQSGKEYLVYSWINKRSDNSIAKLFAQKSPTLGIKVYAGTKPITEALEDLKFLGNGNKLQ